MTALLIKRLSETSVLPTRGSPLSAGYDLSSAYDVTIPSRGKGLVKTDLAFAIPEGCYGRVAPRSGLAWKKHIDVGAGVIDADYRGNVGVVLFNHGTEDLIVKRGDRIAQLILEKIEIVPIQEVKELPSSERGAGGFGSTGTGTDDQMRISSEAGQESECDKKRRIK
uniref:Deoxyuridine 5'-triphosphate nucleotidohydrolase n=2 Tax=Hirondellea gigas TaxID=1518452 RepID=A0A6A7GAR1_9CRUS